MNYTQNEKIEQVTDITLVIGVDVGSQFHYARAFDNRGKELTKRVLSFQNSIEGFNTFNQWVEKIRTENDKTDVMIGCEPTGHYWFAFAKYVSDHQMTLVMVNPFSVKKIKELDDNSPKKTDIKDPKTIAKLVVDGRYSIPYMPEKRLRAIAAEHISDGFVIEIGSHIRFKRRLFEEFLDKTIGL